MTSTPAGWHPDPTAPGQLRYWDGLAWTEHRAPGAPPSSALPVAMAPTYVASPVYATSGRVVVSDQSTSSVGVVIAWILTVLTIGYFLPWAVAESRGKSNSLAIGLLNFFLGWTLIGWIVALVMACTSHQRYVV